MSAIAILSRNCTTFTKSNELDEEALRAFLQPFVDSKIAVFLGSGGSGEANSLTRDELRRVYEIGVDVCKGKIPVWANHPEVRSAQEVLEIADLAVAAGVDGINFYGPAGLHGYQPTDAELMHYFDTVLSATRLPVMLAPHPPQGYTPRPALIAALANKYHQVVSVDLAARPGDAYLMEIRELVKRDDVSFSVPLLGSVNLFALGATSLTSSFPNVLPQTIRLYVDLYERGDYPEMGRVYDDLRRFGQYVERWSGARWQKMAMRFLKLPGGEGGLRLPYLMPSEHEVQRFGEGLLALNIPELNGLMRDAGIR